MKKVISSLVLTLIFTLSCVPAYAMNNEENKENEEVIVGKTSEPIITTFYEYDLLKEDYTDEEIALLLISKAKK